MQKSAKRLTGLGGKLFEVKSGELNDPKTGNYMKKYLRNSQFDSQGKSIQVTPGEQPTLSDYMYKFLVD